jgi:succinate dehydrogenase / fumarate reductase flavoprotein subunit
MYDTVKGSDWLGDQDAIEFMCRKANEVVVELEHYGMPFDRLDDGKIYQRPFGGHMSNFGEKPVRRSCAAADRTGHAMLHAMYQRNVKANTQFFVEWMALDLVRDADGDVLGVTAMDMETGEIVVFHAKATIFATGGAGRILLLRPMPSSIPATVSAWRRAPAFPLEDMEFWQFHPTGVAGAGVLITEGVRGEGGILRNSATASVSWSATPRTPKTWPRATWCRAPWSPKSTKVAAAGRTRTSCCSTSPTSPETIMKRLPGIREIAIQFAGVDPIKEPIPVVPTCHYQMGGIPTNYHGQVVVPKGR